MQWVTCNFARDPLRSYFDEPQKNEIHLLYLHFIFPSFLFIICEVFIKILQNKQRRDVINQHVWLLHSTASRLYDMTSVERYVGQSAISFIGDVAYAYRRMKECRSSTYEPRWSKIGSSKEIADECKYYFINMVTFARVLYGPFLAE